MKNISSILRHLTGRKPGRRQAKVAAMKSEPNRMETLGFLHIPKTGGSGITQFGRKMTDLGHKFPITLAHHWTAKEAFRHFPDMKLAFIIRDPIERIISGFNSRLRMGRPRTNYVWSTSEAIAFNYFASADQMLDGLNSPDERVKSAAHFALANISHIKHGYEHYFGSVKFVENHADRFVIVRQIGQLDEFLEKLGGLIGLSPDLVKQHYEITHVAPKPTKGIVAGLSPEATAAARKYLAKEYQIYNALLKLSRR